MANLVIKPVNVPQDRRNRGFRRVLLALSSELTHPLQKGGGVRSRDPGINKLHISKVPRELSQIYRNRKQQLGEKVVPACCAQSSRDIVFVCSHPSGCFVSGNVTVLGHPYSCK